MKKYKEKTPLGYASGFPTKSRLASAFVGLVCLLREKKSPLLSTGGMPLSVRANKLFSLFASWFYFSIFLAFFQ